VRLVSATINSKFYILDSRFEIRDSEWQVPRATCRILPGNELSLSVLAPKRLFVGVGLPASCKAPLLSLNPNLTGLRWLTAEQLHLTLSFLGDMEAAAEDRLLEALHQVRVPSFFLPLSGVGVFNVRGRPSVVWAGVGKGHPHLFALHRRIQDAVIQVGLEPDLKPFHPHITIGRAKGISRQALQPFLRKHAETNFGMFEVKGFELYSSVLAAEGAIHQVEMRQEF
jgi:RNA 2',3'-cyclic 3'-phosphodiesterase